MFEVDLGQPVPFQARLVALWWDARSVPERDDVGLRSALSQVRQGPGVYAVTGALRRSSPPRRRHPSLR
jgi:hypothetical protein